MGMYRKNYLCVCEGQQEEMYLNHVAMLISDFPNRAVKFNTIVDSPKRLTKSYVEYDSAALFDYDFNDVQFTRNIELCDRLNSSKNSGKRKGGKCTYHAFSNVNFDLWLILHKEDYNRSVSRNDEYLLDVKRIYDIEQKENIKNESVIKKILGQIKLDDVKMAIHRATRIREGKIDTDKIFVGSSFYYPNPDFTIHDFLKLVLEDCGEL